MNIKLKLRELMAYRRTVFVTFVFCMMASFSFFAIKGMQRTSAASTAGFNAGNIISDAVMSNYNSMSMNDIQNFLTSKNPCNDRDYNKYLRLKSAYPNNDWHWDNGHFICLSEERFGDGEALGSGQTAAEIIYQAAHDYQINPQVILVLLQKEQGLITDTYPNKVQYRAATGYGCPDTAACSTQYYGFKNQVRNAASMFRQVLDGGWSNYPAYKTVYIQYNPNSACGGTNVYIENRATSALYRYTPYQPNASALNAGYGTGDTCGAYGNRNFYLYFADWFGSTQAQVNGVETVIPEGIYGLVSRVDQNQIIEVYGGGTANGSNVSTWNRNASGYWQWKFDRGTDGYYTITNVKTNKTLDLADSSAANGSNVRTWSANPSSCTQKWKVYQTPDNNLTFESACMSGMVLSLASAVSANATNIQINITNNTNAQKWQIYAGQTVANGVYTINSALNNKKAVDVYDARKTNGTNVQIWDNNGTAAQKWDFTYNAAGDYYTIINTNSNLALDLYDAKPRNKGNIQVWVANNTCAQQWRVIPTSSDKYFFVSLCSIDKVIDADNASTTNQTNVQLYTANNTLAQKWEINPTPVVADGTYTILSRLNQNKAVDISGGAETAKVGTNIQLWDSNGTAAQRWSMAYNSSEGAYVITNPLTKKVLYLDGAGKKTSNQTNVRLDNADGTCSQFWKITRSSDGSYLITTSCAPNQALDVDDARTTNGTNIQIWISNFTLAQKWTLVAI